MAVMRRPKRAIAGLLSVSMLVQTTGCMTWKTVSLSVAAVENPKNKVQVVLKEGGTVTSDSVRARGDSVVTYQQAGVGAIPLAQVKEVKVRRSNSVAQAAVILGLLVGVGVAYIAGVRSAD